MDFVCTFAFIRIQMGYLPMHVFGRDYEVLHMVIFWVFASVISEDGTEVTSERFRQYGWLSLFDSVHVYTFNFLP